MYKCGAFQPEVCLFLKQYIRHMSVQHVRIACQFVNCSLKLSASVQQMLSAGFVEGKPLCELLFVFYCQSLRLHNFQFPLGYLPSTCVIKLLVCDVKQQKAPRHDLLLLSHFSDCRGRIHKSSVLGRTKFFRECIVLLIVWCIDALVLKHRMG